MLLRVLASLWLLLGLILLGWSLSGVLLKNLMLLTLLLECLTPPMSGLMVVWFWFFFAHQSEHRWRTRRWGHVDSVCPVVGDGRVCKDFCSVLGPSQTVQRAEVWGVILALQSSGVVHLGVDDLNVVRHVGRLLDGRIGFSLVELVNDGDLLLLIERMLQQRGLDTVRITKVKGHADS